MMLKSGNRPLKLKQKTLTTIPHLIKVQKNVYFDLYVMYDSPIQLYSYKHKNVKCYFFNWHLMLIKRTLFEHKKCASVGIVKVKGLLPDFSIIFLCHQ